MTDEQSRPLRTTGRSGDADMSAWLEDAWMQRYLDRTLSDHEVAWFEAYCLDRDHLLSRIEADLELRDALAAAPLAHVGEPRTAPRHRLLPPALRRVTALAATLALGIAVGALAIGLGPDPQIAVTADVTRIVFDTTRGAVDAGQVDHREARSPWVVIDIALPPDASGALLRIEGEPDQPLRLSNDAFVTALVSRDFLQRQPRMSVAYISAGAPVLRDLPLPPDWESFAVNPGATNER